MARFGFVRYRKTSFAWLLFGLAAGFLLGTKGAGFLIAQLEVLAWKVLLVGAAVGIAHLMRKQLFHYIDLSGELEGDRANAGRIFLGIALFYAAIIYSLVNGL
jgi:hypothetical protein